MSLEAKAVANILRPYPLEQAVKDRCKTIGRAVYLSYRLKTNL